jgi:flagellar M-ring protein FliF
MGLVQRLTVAVLVDDRVSEEGGERTPLTNEEIQRLTTLVQQTIGFDQERGDQVNVINASFTPVAAPEALPEPSILENPWVKNSVKYLLAFIIIMVLIFVIVRTSVKSLTQYTPPAPVLAAPGEGGAEGGGGAPQLEHQPGAIPMPTDHDQKVDFARAMVGQDARRVANVVKDWIGTET